MITTLFSKSRPIGYMVISVMLLIVYVLNVMNDLSWTVDFYGVVKKSILFVLIVLSVFLVQFITFKNQLSDQNLYSLYLYACFLILFSSYFDNSDIIISNFFILLALRRSFSLHTLKASKLKIFDAALWILVAMLFEPWTVLFMLPLYFAILWYLSEDYRNWFIPLVAVFCISVLFYTYCLYTEQSFTDFFRHHFFVDFNFSYFENVYQNIALAIFSSIVFLFVTSQIFKLRSLPISDYTTYKKILICFIVGAAIYVISADKSNSLLVFTFFPLSIFGANYVQSLPRKWMKETVLIAIFVISFFLSMAGL
ncbi:DUF6427 family protein [Myroides ceti]|uniref:DUF6427 family protein n=1 Tax=Paenimyroides ceti TaxID=395087 RepID=A0ABT8CXV3_9FLAO|nr:DUF6427 family protein [Paenimyroides ceti]MDN3708546.1 DUF6427 family protein [Paenimyroides ceti]